MNINIPDNMCHAHDVEIKFEGKHIRIGISKDNLKTYIQYKKYDPDNHLWIEFNKDEFLDYKEYMEKTNE